MTNKPTPTDAEIDVMVAAYLGDCGPQATRVYSFASAVLAKWGQPAQAAEPVAWLDPWTGTKVTTDYDAYGKHGIPLYTAPQPVEREPLSAAQKQHIHNETGAGHALICLVESYLLDAHGIKGGQHGTET